MAQIVNIHEAKTHLSRLLERVAQGHEIVIARSGKPIARLVPVQASERVLGFLDGSFDESFFDALPEDELRAWDAPM